MEEQCRCSSGSSHNHQPAARTLSTVSNYAGSFLCQAEAEGVASVSPPPFSFASSSPLFDAATHLSRRDLRHCLDERLSLRSRGDGDRDRRGVNATTTTSKQHTIAAIPPPSFPACLAGFLCPGNPKKRRTRHCRSEAALVIVSPTKCVWAQEHKSM